MRYKKELLVLRRTESQTQKNMPLSALARIEIEDGVAEFHFSVVNLFASPNCRYYALLIDSNKEQFEFDLGLNPTTFNAPFFTLPNLENGVALGFYMVKDYLPLTLAFCTKNANFSLADFKKILAEKYLNRHKEDMKALRQKEQEESKSILSTYNDEAVATENYFELDKQINQKLFCIKEDNDEDLQLENELLDCSGQPQKEKEQGEPCFTKNEARTSFGKEDLEDFSYLSKVKNELDSIFLTYPEEQSLINLFPNSKWAKISYNKDKFYVVGLVKIQDIEYICYGVPAPYSKQPPSALKGYASFIPKSIFDMHGDGFWIMFQDAISGKSVMLGEQS